MAGRKKGTPKTGGRKVGTLNKKTAELIKAIEESGLTPLQYLTSEYRNEDNPPSVRIQAAIAAASYVHQKLSSIELESTVTANHVVSDKPLDIDEWIEKYGTQEGETTH